MAIELVPVPPLRDLSKSQDVRRIMDHLNAIQTQVGRLSDNADLPDTPSAIAVRQGAGKVVEIAAIFAEPPFPWTAECWRNTTNDVTTATKIETKTGHNFHDTNVTYGSTYYYWVRTVGLNGTNYSGWSPSSGHSLTVQQVLTVDIANSNITTQLLNNLAATTDKIDNLGVTTGKVSGTAITTAKRQLLNQQSLASSISFAANEMAIKQDDNVMTHNLGVLTSMTTYLGTISGEDTGEVELSGVIPASGTSTTFDTIVCAVSVSTAHAAVTIDYTVYWTYW